MDISIIIPHHQNKRMLRYCLDTLNNSVPFDTEIVVVANNSNEEELEIEIDEKRFRTVTINSSIGYGAAINAGAEAAKGRTLIFCDNDTFFPRDWLLELVKLLDSDRNIGTVSSKLISPFTSRIVDYGIAFTKYNAPHPFMDQPSNHTLTCQARNFQSACSAVMLIEKDLFNAIGRFPDDRHVYYNDIELCLKLKEFNKECWVAGKSIAYHKGSFQGSYASSYKSQALKGDQKGVFMAKHGHKIEVDMGRFFSESYRFFRQRNPLESSYIAIDMLNVIDRGWYIDIVKSQFDILDTYEFPTYDRDATSTSLMNHLGINLLRTRVPMIYLVDRFISLRDNALWAELRPFDSDIVIDRNANYETFASVTGQS